MEERVRAASVEGSKNSSQASDLVLVGFRQQPIAARRPGLRGRLGARSEVRTEPGLRACKHKAFCSAVIAV